MSKSDKITDLLAEIGLEFDLLKADAEFGRAARAAWDGINRREPVAKRARARKRRPGIDTAKVLAVLDKKGQSLGDVAAKVGGDKEQVAAALRKLRAEKKAAVHGKRGKARWVAR